MSQQEKTGVLYDQIVARVIEESRERFQSEGADHQVLGELQKVSSARSLCVRVGETAPRCAAILCAAFGFTANRTSCMLFLHASLSILQCLGLQVVPAACFRASTARAPGELE